MAFSHDPDAGTLYCYFTELESGQASYELEYPGALLLDADGAVVGLRLDLDDEVTLDQLELALAHEGAALDMATGFLRVVIPGALVVREEPLAETALIDLDDDGRLLGADLAVPEQHRTAAALAPLAPLMVEVDARPQPVDLGTAALRPVGPGPSQDEGDQPHADDAGAAEAAASDQQPAFRSGYVALVGKPNVGKSTLLNRLLGQTVAIVSPRPQTTRVPLRGILNSPNAQIVFVDTPGIHDPRHKLGTFMVELARRTIPDADIVCFTVDISVPPSQLDEKIAGQVRRARGPKLLVLNKVDIKVRGETHLEAYQALGEWDMELAVSARTGAGLETLVSELVARLPVAPPPYPTDQVADQSERHLAAELVREKVLRYTDQEVPHAVAVEVDEWDEREQGTYIRMTVNVEKESQKGIVIGAGGLMLKRIGTAAREDIERALGHQVFLELWVKARPNWRDDPSSLGWLGYNAKDWT
ncbi:MAG: GTPase Era [Chloroflexales bacterium]|nr:GTPase Era [Chloroflexales bacterium]